MSCETKSISKTEPNYLKRTAQAGGGIRINTEPQWEGEELKILKNKDYELLLEDREEKEQLQEENQIVYDMIKKFVFIILKYQNNKIGAMRALTNIAALLDLDNVPDHLKVNK